MDRPRFYRGLRIAWTVVFGILCVLLIALWVWSYLWGGSFELDTGSRRYLISLIDGEGEVAVTGSTSKYASWNYACFRLDEPNREYHRNRIHDNTVFGLGFEFHPDPDLNNYNVLAPMWLLSATIFACTIVPWIDWCQRFSLRTLLIATTLVAILLATAVHRRVW